MKRYFWLAALFSLSGNTYAGSNDTISIEVFNSTSQGIGLEEAFDKVKKHRKRYDGNPVFYLRGDFSYWSKFSDLSSRKFLTVLTKTEHYKIFCVNGNTGFRNESRIYYFIHLQNEKDYERKKSSSA